MGIGFISLFEVILVVMFVAVLGIFLVNFIGGIRTWNRNNHSPRLTVPVTVVTKRTNVSYYHHGNAGDISGAHGYYTTSSTTFYVTFQVESGDRMELAVSGQEYGMLAEGDQGCLTFQGTRYISFERVN